jgi:hypothetical protein
LQNAPYVWAKGAEQVIQKPVAAEKRIIFTLVSIFSAECFVALRLTGDSIREEHDAAQIRR